MLLLLIAGIVAFLIAFILVQLKAAAVWRLITVVVVLVVACRACSDFTRVTTTQSLQSVYVRGLRQFVGDLRTMTIAGRTDEVAKACERFDKEFNIWYTDEAASNFWNLVVDTSQIAQTTNHTVEQTRALSGARGLP